MAQRVEAPDAKPEVLGLIPRAHTVKERRNFLKVSSDHHTCTAEHTHTENINKWIKKTSFEVASLDCLHYSSLAETGGNIQECRPWVIFRHI